MASINRTHPPSHEAIVAGGVGAIAFGNGWSAASRRCRSTPGDQLFMTAYNDKNMPTRIDHRGREAVLKEQEIRAATAMLPIKDFALMASGDAYYYEFKDRVFAPAYKLTLADEDATLVYIDAVTDQVARIADSNSRTSRWFRNGLHGLDFIPQRPIWDVITLLLLTGVTFVCGTGTWMSIKRVRRDIKVWAKR